jgi:hypothetical protein
MLFIAEYNNAYNNTFGIFHTFRIVIYEFINMLLGIFYISLEI